MYDEEGYCYGNSKWFISSVDMCFNHRLFMETLFRRHNICYNMPQNITKLAIQAYMFMSRRQKETLTKDHFIQKFGQEIKRYITFKLKDFRGIFSSWKKREECINSLVDKSRKRVAAMSFASKKTEGWRNSSQTDKKVVASNKMN